MIKRITSILVLGCSLALAASAQSLQTAYFLDNYVYSYQLNPASQPDSTRGFFGIGIDNLSLGVNSNIGLNSFLFPVTIDGQSKLVTGLHSAVPSSTFLDAIKDKMLVDANLYENIFSFGFATGDSFITVEANIRADMGMELPKEFLSLLKNGTEKKGSFSIGDVSADGAVYAELAGGYSRRISDRLTVGGRLKILAGVGEASLDLIGLNAEVGDEIKTDGRGEVKAHVLNGNARTDSYGDLEFDYGDFTAGSLSYGVAFDLGAEYRLLDNLTISASINDLGGIVWKNRQESITTIDSIESNDVMDLKSTGANDFIGVGARFNAGARYDLSELFSVGLLGTVRTGRFGWAETRAGATLSPGKVFSLAASAGVNTYGACFGAAMSLKVPIVNLHLGIDSIATRFTPQYIPVNKLHTRVNAGLAIAF